MWLKLIVLLATFSFIAAKSDPIKLYRDIDVEGISLYTDPFDGKDYRLPNNTIPLHYDIWLSTNIHNGIFDFDGRVTIQIQAIENTPNITIHYREVTIVKVDLFNAAGFLLQSDVPIETREDVEFLIITPSLPLVQGQIYSVEITYIGLLRNDDAGFYRSSYLDSIGRTVWLATTQFESTDARHAFPCYDEPGIRSTFSIEIRHDSSYSAISNMPQASITPETGTYVVTKFEKTPSVQTYLIAFTVSDFTFVQDTTGKIPQRIFARPQTIENGESAYALSISGRILTTFEQYIGVNYTLPKMDQAAIPDFAAGAMENWGLVTYRESALLFNEATGTTSDRAGIASTIAHEFAHQWFGNLVSPAWWSFLWMNEGFATLYASHINSLLFPEERWLDTFLVNTVQAVFETDSNRNIRPMSYYVESSIRIDNLFDNVAYSKSGSVLKMFQNVFGDSTWRKGLNKYLNTRGLNNALPENLYQGLQQAVDEDNALNRPNVATVMSSWETQSGFPFVTVARNGNQLTFEQNRFMYENRNSTNLWWIPINYVVGSNPNFENTKPDLWMQNVSSISIQSSTAPKPFTANDWIVVNIQQSGYYRVNYDNNLWNLIIQQLNRDGDEYNRIHLFNRAQLIDDSFNLARGELINYDTVLGILNYLEKETDYVPWASANRANTLLNRWLSGSSVYPEYQEFMRKNVQALFNRLGVRNVNNEQRVDRYARTIAINIACQFQLSSCLTQTLAALQTSLNSGVAIVPDLVSSIYCNGIRTATVTTYLAVESKLLQSTVQSERNTIITSLGCIQNSALLATYLNLAIQSQNSLSNAEKSRVLTSPINNGEASLRTLINFVASNYEAINSINALPTVCSNIASRVSNQQLFDEFDSLTSLLRDNGFLTETQVISYRNSASTIIAWQATNLEHVEKYFAHEDTSTIATTSSTTPSTVQTSQPTEAPSSSPSAESTTESAGRTMVVSTLILTTSVLVNFLC